MVRSGNSALAFPINTVRVSSSALPVWYACHSVTSPVGPLGAGVGVGASFLGTGVAVGGTGVGVALGAQAEISKLTRTRTPTRLNSTFFISFPPLVCGRCL